jgi:hypothetical protein
MPWNKGLNSLRNSLNGASSRDREEKKKQMQECMVFGEVRPGQNFATHTEWLMPK